jgi:acetyl-CoA acetyltransferase
MKPAFLVDGVRTPIGNIGGALAEARPDDLAAHSIRALLARHPQLDPARIGDVILGCANQAGRGQPRRRAHGRPARGAAR